MTDVRVKEFYSLEGVTMDWLLRSNGLLDEREELASAARVALGTDRLADANEILPDLDSTDRRGWWGDLEAEEIWGGWPIGCKNWLLMRAKITDAPSMEGSTLERARIYTQSALQPFIDKKIATQIDVTSARTELERIVVSAQIYRGPDSEIDLRYQLLWQEEPIVDEATFIEPPPRFFGFTIVVTSPVLGHPIFNTKSPVHLPEMQLTVSAPVFGSPNFRSNIMHLTATNLTISSPTGLSGSIFHSP